MSVINFATPSINNTEYENGLWITRKRHCSWKEIECTAGSVVELDLGHFNIKLAGLFATEIGLLTNVEKLDISNNALQGTITSLIFQLPLFYLGLEDNEFLGTLASQKMGRLSNLQCFP